MIPLSLVDWTPVFQAAKEYTDALESGEMEQDTESGYRNAVFEAAMIAIYGPEVFAKMDEW